MHIVYFSTNSGNTERFVGKLNIESSKIPLKGSLEDVNDKFILVTPSYGGGDDSKAVPSQVIRFLNRKENRDLMIGVVSTGNRNFGKSFGIAGRIISGKCNVPHLGSVELFGTPEDVSEVRQEILNLYRKEIE